MRAKRLRLGVQLQVLYNAVRGTSKIADEDARRSLVAMIRDIAETAGLDWSHGTPALDPLRAERAMGRCARAFQPRGEKGGAA
jgi:hypothetical protein